jgi:4-amino-4-deoxy-L-arabinose transferase-like glycosyltransferase
MPATETMTLPEAPAVPSRAGEGQRRALPTASQRRLYLLLFSCAFLMRFGFMLWHRTYHVPPARAAEVTCIAAHIATDKGFSSPFCTDTGPTAWVAPVYPYFVSLAFRLFGPFSETAAAFVLSLQCVMAAATGMAIYALGKRTLGERVGFWAAWIWAVSPFFFRWPTSWMWDFPASALILTLILIVTLDLARSGSTKLWLGLGALWGFVALLNPALLSLLPFSVAYAAFGNYEARRQWVRGLAIAAMLFLGIITPWLIRNAVVFGRPVFLRSNYWFEFHLGNYRYSNGMGFGGKHPAGNPSEMAKYIRLGEQDYIQAAKSSALRFVREYPGEFLILTLHRIVWFWDGTPIRYEPGTWWVPWKFWPLSCGGLLGLVFTLTRRPRGWLLYAASLVIYPIPYDLAFTSARYRHAIEPQLILLTVYLAHVLWREFRLLAGGLTSPRRQRNAEAWSRQLR